LSKKVFNHKKAPYDGIKKELQKYYRDYNMIFYGFKEIYQSETGNDSVTTEDQEYQLFYDWFINLDPEVVKSIITLIELRK
jgi:hypothetical protein